MQIGVNSVVTFDYTLKDDDGDVLDSSDGGDPLTYLHGAENIVPGLEAALTGHAAGDKLDVVVKAEDGYGLHDDSLVQAVPRANLPDGPVEIGMQFNAHGADGHRVVTVVAVEGEAVVLDANHPLAGQNLHFSIEIRSVRAATGEEIEHGHVHGDGGHHHH